MIPVALNFHNTEVQVFQHGVATSERSAQNVWNDGWMQSSHLRVSDAMLIVIFELQVLRARYCPRGAPCNP